MKGADMAQPTIGPAVLAWKISQYPQYWIPLIVIMIGAAVAAYIFLPGMANADPRPEAGDVKAMYISQDPTGAESSFRQVPHEQFYPELYQCTTGAFAARRMPDDYLILTVRVVTKSDKTTVFKFYDGGIVQINGKNFQGMDSYMFLDMVQSVR